MQLICHLDGKTLSNFENDSTPGVLEPGPNALAHILGGIAEVTDFFLRTSTLTASNFAAN